MTELKRDVVFLSHRKTDEEIAQLIRQFLIQTGVKDDDIFLAFMISSERSSSCR